MRLISLAAALGLCLTPVPARACSLSNWNVYEDFARTPGRDLLARAATIDWISIEPPAPPKCPEFPDDFSRPDVDDDETAWAGIPEFCQDPFGEALKVELVGKVRERLKGQSPDRINLLRYTPPWRDPSDRRSDWVPGRWERFSDLRILPSTVQISVSLDERSRAEGRHRDLQFWDDGRVEFSMDRSNSCGGVPTLDPKMSYVVFRDTLGGVMALEPVLHADDLFLGRLRAATAGATDLAASRLPVQAMFGSAIGLVQVRVLSCTGGGRSNESEHARLRVVRGDVGAPYRPFPFERDSRTGEFDFADLWDFYQTRNQSCPVGEDLLLLVASFDGAPRWEGAQDWIDRRFPEWTGAALARLAELDAADTMTPLDFILGGPSPSTGSVRPVRIHDGRIRLSDIPTGLTLTGPEWITVDEAFGWFQAGRDVVSTPVPSSS
ncbi:hypothetical protein ACO2Q1_00675 [Brevundimonas sp. VNH65]|uniref:hypothetical protein n=1 Tax=Brevundimonas sp. VNH65 TaxID=3400917 RepID=UPI003C0F908E